MAIHIRLIVFLPFAVCFRVLLQLSFSHIHHIVAVPSDGKLSARLILAPYSIAVPDPSHYLFHRRHALIAYACPRDLRSLCGHGTSAIRLFAGHFINRHKNNTPFLYLGIENQSVL